MRFMRLSSTVLLVALAHSMPVQADDYPDTGSFTTAGNPDGPDPDDLARCALSFLNKDKSGSYIMYVLDMDAFITANTLRYHVLFKGQCTYNAGHWLETCQVTLNAVVPNPSPLFWNVIETIGPDFLKLNSFKTFAHANAYYATGKAEDGNAVSLARCPFDPARLSAAISTEVSKLSRDDAERMMFADAMQLHAPVMTDLLKATGLSKP